MVLGVVLVLLSVAVFGFGWRAGIVQEFVARRAVMTPIVTLDLPLDRSEARSKAFYLKYPGRYTVDLDLQLRHGPQGVLTAETFVLLGSAEIFDDRGTARLRRNFSITLGAEEVGVTLFEFDTKDVGKGEKHLTLVVPVSPEFREHYSKATLRIQKVPRFAVTY